MIFDLVPEIQDQIFYYCDSLSLKNLSLCSSRAFAEESLKNNLWKVVTIKSSKLLDENFIHNWRYQLDNLKHTIQVSLWDDERIRKARHEDDLNRICTNYQLVLPYFNQNVLCSIYLEYAIATGENISLACGLFKNLTKLHVHGTYKDSKISDETYQDICELEKIRELSLDTTNTNDSNLCVLLTGIPQLRRLNLRRTLVTDNGFTSLVKGQWNFLEYLNLNECYISESGLECISNNLPVEKLYLAFCKVTNRGVSYISKMSQLLELDLRGCSKITDLGIIFLGGLRLLQKLSLQNCSRIYDSGLSNIGNILSLKSLDLKGCYNITDIGIASLTSLSNLEKLNLDSVSVTDTCMMYISRLTNIRELSMERTSITDAGLTSVSRLKDLHYFNAQHTSLTDDCLKYLTLVKSLKTFKYDYTSINEEAVLNLRCSFS